MKDIPFFITENGAAGLVLQEVPYTGKAYITLHDSVSPEDLLEECVGFCKAIDARQVFACNHKCLEQYSVHCRIYSMTLEKNDLPETDIVLDAVTADTLEQFVVIYNEKMTNIPASQYLTQSRAEELLKSAKGYFACRQNAVVGIGIIKDNEVCAIASLEKGAGRSVLCALCKKVENDRVKLEVADTNKKAIELYTALGFTILEQKNIWYRIL